MNKYIISKVGSDCLNVDEEINSFMSTFIPDFNITTLTPEVNIREGLYKDTKTTVRELKYIIDLTSEDKKYIIKKSEAMIKDYNLNIDNSLYIDVEFEVKQPVFNN